jgi:O-antigen/teichoic acid export membrane protein
MGLAFVPLYIKFLGIEAYGLIGFFAMLQASFQILDLGLSQTMNREMARYSALRDKAGEARDLVRTLEVVYWAIGLVKLLDMTRWAWYRS